jgi:hypothetical protein
VTDLPAFGDLLDGQRAAAQLDHRADEPGPDTLDAGLGVQAGDVGVHVGEQAEQRTVVAAVEQIGRRHRETVTVLI